MKKTQKKRGIGLPAAIAAAVLLMLGGGIGLGKGAGMGTGEEASAPAETVVEQPEEQQEPVEEHKTEVVTNVTITVKQDQYLMNEKETTLEEIKAYIEGCDKENTSFVLVDHYASAKAWDQLKQLMTEYEISAVEQ